MTRSRIDLLQGTLAMLILKSLEGGSMHGYQIAKTIEQATDDVLSVEEGSLYPALHRMQQRNWVKARWGLSENNRRARFYRLTRLGRGRLEGELIRWHEMVKAVANVLDTVPSEG